MSRACWATVFPEPVDSERPWLRRSTTTVRCRCESGPTWSRKNRPVHHRAVDEHDGRPLAGLLVVQVAVVDAHGRHPALLRRGGGYHRRLWRRPGRVSRVGNRSCAGALRAARDPHGRVHVRRHVGGPSRQADPGAALPGAGMVRDGERRIHVGPARLHLPDAFVNDTTAIRTCTPWPDLSTFRVAPWTGGNRILHLRHDRPRDARAGPARRPPDPAPSRRAPAGARLRADRRDGARVPPLHR